MHLLLAVLLLCIADVNATPLDDYVNRPDPHYGYNVIDKYRGPDYTLYTINMTSQMWKSAAVMDRPLWWHYLSITVPDNIRFRSSAFMFIEGGNNHAGPPKNTEQFVALTTMLAVGTGSITGNLKMVPNQPIVFTDDPSQMERSEDAIIAWTWRRFVLVNTSDPEILLRMPMTKSAVRGMDTISDFAKKEVALNIDQFYIAGESKRGWTTWTTGAVDKRVKAMSPIVLDCLNLVKNLHHHYRSLGGWTFAFDDYYFLNFTEELDNPNTQKMADIIDPISYNSRLTMPKLIITTGGDEFFLPDDSHYYFDELTSPKYLRVVPNAEHSLDGHSISLFFTLRAFYMSVFTNTPLPQISWVRQQTPTGGRITVTTDRKPLKIDAHYARTLDAKRRDFRLVIGTPGNPDKPLPHPVIWHRTDVTPLGNNQYKAEFDSPKEGWLAFFIQMTFQGVEDAVLEFTTETEIVPDTFPFPDCSGESCRGELV